MRMILAGAAILAATLSVVTVEHASAQRAESVAVVVNDEVISTFDVRQRAMMLLMGQRNLTEPDINAAMSRAAQQLIDERLKLQEAGRRKVEVSDDEINQGLMEGARDSSMTPQLMEQQFAARRISFNTLRQKVRADIAWEKLTMGRFSRRVRISDAEVLAERDRRVDRLAKPGVLVLEILLPAQTPSEFDSARLVADRLMAEFAQVTDANQRAQLFSQRANDISASPTAALDGTRGWAAPDDFAAVLRPTIESLQPGVATGPVNGPDGVYVFMLINRRPPIDPATLTEYNLREVTIADSQRAALDRIVRQTSGCQSLDGLAAAAGAEVIDLGNVKLSELSGLARERLAAVDVGRPTAVFTKSGQAAFQVACEREIVAANLGLPARPRLRQEMFFRALNIQAERYLRDLRREAYIRTMSQR